MKFNDEKKQVLFSVTVKDCDWSYTKGSGSGGQKKNKTSSAVHCTHKLSGAHGYSEATRSQLTNKQDAFVKMANTEEFKKWHRMEYLRRSGEMALIDAAVEKSLKQIRVDAKVNGKWVNAEGVELS